MERRKTVEEIFQSKMEQRLTVGGLCDEDESLLDEFFGEDVVVTRFEGAGSVLRGSGRGAPFGGSLPEPCETVPPSTNRGASKHRTEDFGGYDGGVEVGFEGNFDPDKFLVLSASLMQAKELAGNSPILTENCELFGHVVSVDACGARAGLHYRFKFSLGGVTFFVHHNCPKGRQAVRVRYGAMSLIGRSLFDVHAAVLRILSDIGFTVTKETVSRVDMQVTVCIPIEEVLAPILFGHAVSKVRNDNIHRRKGVCRTFTTGQRGRNQMCIYDKSLEMQTMSVSNPAKFQLMVDEHLGQDYTFDQPLTRVEFRLWRDVLRLMEINTVEDLRAMETDIVHFLTTKWFRVLSVPKSMVKGHEHTAKVHEHWVHVQECFRRFFPGLGRPVAEITLNRERPIICDASSLLKQAAGCLKTAFALESGVQSSIDSLFARVFEWAHGVKQNLFSGLNERALQLEIESGVSVLERSMSDRARREADNWYRRIQYERGRCFG